MSDLLVKIPDAPEAQVSEMAERVKRILAQEFGVTVEVTLKPEKAKKAQSPDKEAKSKNLVAKITRGLDQVKLMQEGKLPKKSARDFVKELKNSK
jgi:23S rRNA pseudoU1915 N3-methylase RlmH